MRAMSSRSAMTDLAAVRGLLAKERKKLVEERRWHAWTAVFRIHEDIRCTSLEIQIAELKTEMDQQRDVGQEASLTESLFAEPRVLRLWGGMPQSWDVIAICREDLKVHQNLIRQGVDVKYSTSAILEISADVIRRYELLVEKVDGNTAEVEENGRRLAECQRQLESETLHQDELRVEVQRLTLLLTDVKRKVGKVMVEDIQRMKQLEEQDEEVKSKNQC